MTGATVLTVTAICLWVSTFILACKALMALTEERGASMIAFAAEGALYAYLAARLWGMA